MGKIFRGTDAAVSGQMSRAAVELRKIANGRSHDFGKIREAAELYNKHDDKAAELKSQQDINNIGKTVADGIGTAKHNAGKFVNTAGAAILAGLKSAGDVFNDAKAIASNMNSKALYEAYGRHYDIAVADGQATLSRFGRDIAIGVRDQADKIAKSEAKNAKEAAGRAEKRKKGE